MERVADRSERVAKLVRQHGEKLVLASVGILERLLGGLSARDVFGDPDHPEEFSRVGPDRKSTVPDPKHLAVGTNHAILIGGWLASMLCFERGGHLNDILLVDRIKIRAGIAVKAFGGFTPDCLVGGAHVNHLAAIGVRHPKDVANVFGQLSEAEFGFLKVLIKPGIVEGHRGLRRESESEPLGDRAESWRFAVGEDQRSKRPPRTGFHSNRQEAPHPLGSELEGFRTAEEILDADHALVLEDRRHQWRRPEFWTDRRGRTTLDDFGSRLADREKSGVVGSDESSRFLDHDPANPLGNQLRGEPCADRMEPLSDPCLFGESLFGSESFRVVMKHENNSKDLPLGVFHGGGAVLNVPGTSVAAYQERRRDGSHHPILRDHRRDRHLGAAMCVVPECSEDGL